MTSSIPSLPCLFGDGDPSPSQGLDDYVGAILGSVSRDVDGVVAEIIKMKVRLRALRLVLVESRRGHVVLVFVVVLPGLCYPIFSTAFAMEKRPLLISPSRL